MHLVTVRFDRVFDIVHQTHRKRLCTFFSFQHGEALRFGVCIPGTPRLEPGMVVTACLLKQDDWQTLAGWIDHASGRTVADSPALGIGVLLTSIGITTVWFNQGMPSHMAAWGALAFFALLNILNAREMYTVYRVRSALKSCVGRPGHPGKGSAG